MKFLAITLIVHNDERSPTERFREVVGNAVLAEELGFDGFGVGERHERPFISSSPPVVLSHIAAKTSRIRLFTAVTTLSLLDPVRAYEDYATLDHLSDGRLELIIGKGNGAAQAQLFHVTAEDQWDRNREGYDLFRRLWREDKVTWAGRFRPALTEAETWPRPLQRPIRVWHGSATSKESVELAAYYGDPLFSANVTNPIEPYAELIDHYRERWAHYGHDPAEALVGAGTAGYYAARSSQEAIETYRPIFDARLALFGKLGLKPVFTTLEDAIERSSILVGSPQQIIDKVLRYRKRFGHEVMHLHADADGLTPKQHRDALELFQAEIAPVLRQEIPQQAVSGEDAMTLSILDLAPIPSGGTARDALLNTLDLARRAESFGYRRYWLAEHHFAPGVASSAPAVLIGLVAAATSRIRVGSGAVQLGHQTPLSVVEQFGLIDALYPGRIDLGIGRSGQRRAELAAKTAPADPALSGRPAPAPPASAAPPAPGEAAAGAPPVSGGDPPGGEAGRVVGGLLIPPPFDWSRLAAHPHLAFHASLLQQPGARTPDFAEQIDDVIAFLTGNHQAHAVPGEGAEVELWILGSSGGQSAQVAGERGLPFAANYHVSPSSVLEAVEAYRQAFKPSKALAEPYVIVSADVVVAADDATARELAKPYGLWVRSIRTGAGARTYPTPEEADAHVWSAEDLALVKDRIDTRFVGTPDAVAERLRVLRRVTGADELLVTTITHDHADRVRSFELLAGAWDGRA